MKNIKIGQIVNVKGYPNGKQTDKDPYEIVFISPQKTHLIIGNKINNKEFTINTNGFWDRYELEKKWFSGSQIGLRGHLRIGVIAVGIGLNKSLNGASSNGLFCGIGLRKYGSGFYVSLIIIQYTIGQK